MALHGQGTPKENVKRYPGLSYLIVINSDSQCIQLQLKLEHHTIYSKVNTKRLDNNLTCRFVNVGV